LWYKEIDGYLCSIGLTQTSQDQNLYTEDDGILLLLYVDDILIANSPDHEDATANIRNALQSKYKMTDLRQARKFLGINIEQTTDCIRIHQESYICQILTRFEMMDAINL
jgi:hypothetical protein